MPLVVPQLFHPGYQAGSVYPTYGGRKTTASAVTAVDIIYVYPFVVYYPLVVKTLLARCVTAGAGSAIKMALWADHPTLHRPTGAPIAADDTGQATTSSGSNQTYDPTDFNLGPGWYWAGCKFTGTLPAMVAIDASMDTVGFFMGFPAADTMLPRPLLSVAHAYATAFPTLTGNDSFAVSSAVAAVINLGL